MKRGFLLCSVLSALNSAASAQATSSVTFYGLVDTGIEYVTNANAAGNSIVKMPSPTGIYPSRFGFRGKEELGGGLSAIYQLESGFSLDTATQTQGSRLFGRQAWTGLKGNFGSLTLGRQYNMTFHSLVKADVMGPSIHGLTNMDTYLPNARSDNSIAYLGEFSKVALGASYSLGRDASPAGASGPSATNCAGESAADKRACRQMTALLAYDNQILGVSGSWDMQYGDVGATNGLTSSSHSDRRIALSAYANLSGVKVGGGWLKRATRNASHTDSDLSFVGVSFSSGQWSYSAQYARLAVQDSPNRSALYAGRATYALSKRTAVYGSYGYITNRGDAAIPVDAGGTVGKGMHQHGLMTGVSHTF